MLIDWFTVGAQIVNFLVLVWLLKRFLYRPVLKAIDAREKRIAAELGDADVKKAEALKERDEFQAKNKNFEDQRTALMVKATDEAKAERERLLGEARKATDAFRALQEKSVQNERERMSGEIIRLVTGEVFEITRKALADLANVSLEERIGEVFTRRLREMDDKAKEALAGAFETASEPAVVRSTFDLGAAQRAAIQNALNEVFSSEIRLRFETSPGGVCGIELSSNGQKLSWNVASYLTSLERKMDALLDAEAAPVDSARPQVVEPLPDLRSVA
jgi:F-type H+-transporting ATPase subunit b